MLRFITAGESHGPGLTAVIDGIPAGLKLSAEDIDLDLARRQLGYGRGGRMKIEKDKVAITAGVRHGLTIGSPIALVIENKDWANWSDRMSVAPAEGEFARDLRPRPGHADLTGLLKTNQNDIRSVLERASARETAARVALGAVAKVLIHEIGIDIVSHVVRIGAAVAGNTAKPVSSDLDEIDASPVRCFNASAGEAMVGEIKEAAGRKDTLGGIFEVIAYGCPPGLGSYTQWDKRLNANLCRALAGIPAIKGVEVGAGFALGALPGSEAHDEIEFKAGSAKGESRIASFSRPTNRAGGIEGGMSNGEPIVLRAVMKPIPTLGSGLRTVDLRTGEEAEAMSERSDICAVPAASVIGEAVTALELAAAALDKFGGDSLAEFKRNYEGYIRQILTTGFK